MKIEIVTDTFAPDVNGVAMTLGRLTEGLRRRGHSVNVIHTAGNPDGGESRGRAIPLPGYKEVRVGLPMAGELRSRWGKKKPDAVYVATESPLGKSALETARALGIAVACGFHTNFHEYISRYKLGLFQPLAFSYLKKFHNRADRTLAPSTGVVKRLTDEGFENVHLMGRGVDTELFHPGKRCATLRAEWGAAADSPVVITVGRVAAEKNLGLAVRGFGEILEKFPGARCVIVGDGPVKTKLGQQYPWIHFTGMLSGEELARAYASADILLFPSETETFGNVLLEGMASGLVCVSYDYAASELHVRHGQNGLKAAKSDETAFLEKCLEAVSLIGNHPMRAAARNTALEAGWDNVVTEFEEHLAAIARTPESGAAEPSGKRRKLECRTVFLSDIHLGTPDCKADEVVDFLKHIRCNKLVLNGDIIDGWALKRGGKWSPRHSRVIRRIIKVSEKDDTEVLYLRGNHDEILERFLPLAFGKIRLMKEAIHTAADGKKYLVVHGDGFDSVSTNHRWLALAGAVGYDFLLRVNRFYNHYRAWRGKEYFSLSKRVKARVKSAVCFVDRYEELLQALAAKRGCDGIICGHIHTPEDKLVGDIRYLNSGDWVESLTAIIEHNDGRMELVEYRSFLAGLAEKSTAEPAALAS